MIADDTEHVDVDVNVDVDVDVDVVAVVIPARDEADRVERCLAAITASVHELRTSPDGAAIDVRIVVVADACTDDTLGRIAQWSSVTAVVSAVGRVGAARAVGVTAVLTSLAGEGVAAGRIWIANTDADSAVPREWLRTHVAAARRGASMLLGTVRPDPGDLDGRVNRLWHRRHRLTDGHPHVHGANMGIRANWYQLTGGFPAVSRDEDVALTSAVVAAGGRVERTGASPVITSGRLTGRAPGGMADYLRRLDRRAVLNERSSP
jgi:glycosyltransferase involved in cell wall biosynthesis